MRLARARVLAICAIPCLSTLSGAQETPWHPPSNLVSTHATAHRRLPNTVADVSVSIQTEAATTADVIKVLGTKSQRLVGYLREQGADRLKTNQLSVEPKIHTVKGGPDQVVGYSGTIGVSFRTTPEKVSDMLSGAMKQGANTLQAVTFSPREEEVDAARQGLAAEATRIALDQATAVTKAAGERVVGVRSFDVDPDTGFQTAAADGVVSRSNFAAQVPVMATAAGDQDIRVNVAMQVEISP